MTEPKPLVEMLGYIGGQDEDLGGYCRSLIIRTDEQERYVLHEMHTYRKIVGDTYRKSINHTCRETEDDTYRERVEHNALTPQFGEIKAKHSKVEFNMLEELLREFGMVKTRLGINPRLPWVETDSRCGYDLPEQEFKDASVRYWEKQLGDIRLTHIDESRLT